MPFKFASSNGRVRLNPIHLGRKEALFYLKLPYEPYSQGHRIHNILPEPHYKAKELTVLFTGDITVDDRNPA